MIKTISACFIILLTFSIESFSQTGSDEYVILTFEMDRNKDMHGTFVYHWIVPADSIREGKSLLLYPVYLFDFYSSDSFDRCCDGDSIDFVTMTTATRFDFTEDQQDQQGKVLALVQENRTLIQTINKKWDKAYKEKIKVFATPIRGDFCSCRSYGRSLRFTDDKEVVYLPNKGFEIIADFWETDMASIIKYWDYSKMEYANSQYRTPK